MRSWRALWMLGLSMAGPGCALVEDGSRNLYVAASTPIEVHREKARNDRWAEAAWQSVTMKDGPSAHSEDFARGFKDGFAEYLFRGGDGEPPLVAPLHYRQYRYQNEKGYQAVQDWFAGYRFGAAAARDSGARRWITSPSALQTELHVEPPPHDAPIVVPIPLPPEQKEVMPLPAPKQLPKEQPKDLPKEQPKEVPQQSSQALGVAPRFGELAKEQPTELPRESSQGTGAPSRLGQANVDLAAPKAEAPSSNDEPLLKAKVTGSRVAPAPVPEPPVVPASTDDEPLLKAKVTGARVATPPAPEPPVLPMPKSESSGLPMPRISDAPEAMPAAPIQDLNNREMLRARIQRIMSGSPKD